MTEQSPSFGAFQNSPYSSRKHSSYFAVYDKFFAPYRGKPITFVEIGVLDGGSLFMWREFFGPEARIIGVELNPAAKRWEEHGFEIFIGSQSDEGFWKSFTEQVGEIDVVLDDGGHTFLQQVVTVEALLPHVVDGGLLVVEDTHTSHMKAFGGPHPRSFVEYAKNIADGINHRSGMVDQGLAKNTSVWGVSFFESFVLFHIDRTESEAKVEEIDNGKGAAKADDFRYKTSPMVARIDDMLAGGGIWSRPGIARTVLSKIRNRLISSGLSRENRGLKRYFRY